MLLNESGTLQMVPVGGQRYCSFCVTISRKVQSQTWCTALWGEQFFGGRTTGGGAACGDPVFGALVVTPPHCILIGNSRLTRVPTQRPPVCVSSFRQSVAHVFPIAQRTDVVGCRKRRFAPPTYARSCRY